MRKLLILPLLVLLCGAQPQADNYFYEFSGSTALTLQQPATNARQIQPQTAWFYCAAAQTVTMTWNMVAATATAATPKPIPPSFIAASGKIFTASNASSGTTGPVYNVPAGVTFPISLSNFRMGTTGGNTNITFTPNGSCTMDITWQEF